LALVAINMGRPQGVTLTAFARVNYSTIREYLG
jgi:bifunctional pyridoxal-dependent enzyme with beta-cystathionase and maltose regulon repressor activities